MTAPPFSDAILFLLKQAQPNLDQLPEVDQPKIERLRAALDAGEIDLDPDRLVQAILTFHQR